MRGLNKKEEMVTEKELDLYIQLVDVAFALMCWVLTVVSVGLLVFVNTPMFLGMAIPTVVLWLCWGVFKWMGRWASG